MADVSANHPDAGCAAPVIHTLPAEILVEIFRMASMNNVNRATPARIPISMAISWVCKTWRDVSLAVPELWTSVDLHSGEHEPTVLLKVAETYLARSQDLPLSIHATLIHRDCETLLDALVHHCTRWEVVDLFLNGSYTLQLNRVLDRVPLLRQLRLNIDAHGHSWLEQTITAFSNAPRLTTIFADEMALKHLILYTNRVSSIATHSTHVRLSFHFAKLFKNLRHLTLCNWKDNPTRITFPSLQSLCLIQNGPTFVQTGILEYFNTPLLESLHIEESPPPSLFSCTGWDTTKVETLSSSSLKTLHLSRILLPEPELLALLASLPILETLEIKEDAMKLTISDTFLQGLTRPCSTCPQLTTLILTGRLQFTDHRLIEMVKSRLQDPDPEGQMSLQSLSITLTADPGRADSLKNDLLGCRLRSEVLVRPSRMNEATCCTHCVFS